MQGTREQEYLVPGDDDEFCFKDMRLDNNQLPESISSMFRINRNENYRLRSNYINYTLPKPKTNFMKRIISYSAVSLLNNLPNSAKEEGISISKIRAILSGI